LYMETMGRIFSSPRKIVLDQTASPTVSYLPLNELLGSSSNKTITKSKRSVVLSDSNASEGY
ncbi:MAG: protease modulator HflK, partial [Bartonella sp.]|nr:protease modulator HflK [Bartonella sp.]